MVEPWFDPNQYAWIPGTCLGILGGIIGTLVGTMAPRGKCRGLVVGTHASSIALCAVLFVIGLIAWFSGQPYGIWYGLGYPGLLGMVIFGSLMPVTIRAYRAAELRKSEAMDL